MDMIYKNYLFLSFSVIASTATPMAYPAVAQRMVIKSISIYLNLFKPNAMTQPIKAKATEKAICIFLLSILISFSLKSPSTLILKIFESCSN